ncbi:hypothetical protein BH10PLA1_BH10PLA1_01600 [soil metagenome]
MSLVLGKHMCLAFIMIMTMCPWHSDAAGDSPAIANDKKPTIAIPISAPAHGTVRDDGTLLVDGKSFFPIGMYHDSLDADYYGEKLLADLKTIADAGFNIAHVSIDFTHDGKSPKDSTAGKAAKLAEENGMYLAVSVYVKNPSAVLAEYNRWPAILISTLGDDFDSDAKGRLKGAPKYPPQRLAELHAETKKIAPRLLTYSSGSSYLGASLDGYESTVDSLAIQIYPIADGSQSRRNELEAMDDIVANYWKSGGPKANKSLMVNIQAFSQDGKQWPTPQEARLQAWVSVLGRAKGIFWYSFYHGGPKSKTLPNACPALWDELKALIPELKQAAPFFTDGKLTQIPNPEDASFDDGEGTWHAGYWEKDGQCLVVVVNTHRSKSIVVDLPVPAARKTRAAFAAQRYDNTLENSGQGRLKGKLAPASTQVYLMETISP